MLFKPDMQSVLPAVGGEQKKILIGQASVHEAAAEAAAVQGDVEAAARLILRALDCERRAGSLGPQVLQLIKPRG